MALMVNAREGVVEFSLAEFAFEVFLGGAVASTFMSHASCEMGMVPGIVYRDGSRGPAGCGPGVFQYKVVRVWHICGRQRSVVCIFGKFQL